MKKYVITTMSLFLFVIGLLSCGSDSGKRNNTTINAICDLMDRYYQIRKVGTLEASNEADELGTHFLRDNCDNYTFDVETDETTPVKTSNFKFNTSILPAVRFTGEIHLENESDLGPIHLNSYDIIPELSIVFYHDDLPLYVSGVAYEPTSGQRLVLNVYGHLRFPHESKPHEYRDINRIVLTKKKIDQKEVEAATDVFKRKQLKVNGELLFDKGILGPVKVGEAMPKLSDSVEGLYDKYDYQKIEHDDDMDGPWTEEYYLFTKNGKEIFRANIFEGKVNSVKLLEGSSFIKTPDGIYVGYSARELFNKIRMEWTNYYDGYCFGSSKHFSYYVNSDDLVKTDIPHRVEDFKEDAKVIGIVYSNN